MLEAKNIFKTYKPKKGPVVQAINDISIKLEDKGLVFLLGKSGSGKSTLLNVLGGLDSVDSGEILIKGKSTRDFSQSDYDSYRNTFIGFVFQEYNILDEFTVGQNIALAIELQGQKATSEKVNEILEQVDLSEYANRKPNELSGGQKQRVAIARALIKNPEIIMADEPTGALDSNTGKMVFDTLKKLSLNKLVIVVSHDREFAEKYGDRVIELADGKIISDIYKYHMDADKVSEGVEKVGDNLIRIKKGYQLSEDDFNVIKSYLSQNQNSDAIISIDENTNRDIKKVARIDEDGSRNGFKNTVESELSVTEYNSSDFKLIKSRLPFKKAFKIGASGLKSKPIRLFFTIVLSAIAFCLFGIAFTAADYNKIDTTIVSIKEANVDFASFSKELVINNDNSSYTYPIFLSDKDIAMLSEKFPNADFRPVYAENMNFGSYENLIGDISSIKNNLNPYASFYSASLSGIVELNNEDLSKRNFSLIGRLPSADNEIAVTNYAYEIFYLGGYKKDDTVINITNENDLIGKKLYFNSYDLKVDDGFTIVGIINTNSNVGSRFDKYKPNLDVQNGESNDVTDYLSFSELQTVINYSFLSVGVVNEGFINRVVAANSNIINASGAEYNINLYDNADNHYISASHFSPYEKMNKDNVLFIDKSNTTLADNEILLSYNVFSEVFLKQINGELLNVFNEKTFKKLSDYCKQSEIIAAFEEAGFIFNDEVAKHEQIMGYLSEGAEGYEENQYATSSNNLKSGLQLHMEYNLDAYRDMKASYPSQFATPNVNLKYFNYILNLSNETNLDVVGLIMDNDFNEYSVYMSQNAITALNIGKTAEPYKCAVGIMPQNKNILSDLVKFSYDDNIDESNYIMQNSVTASLNNVNMLIEDFKTVFLYIGIGFAFFASFLLMTFIATSISYKKREIGILRAVGARSLDVVNIFINESLIIAILNYFIALIMSIVSVFYINNMLISKIGLSLTILHFGFLEALYMLLVAIGTAFLASAIPVLLTTKKKPIDAIRSI